MGQFDSQSVGLPPVGKIGLSESDRGRGLPQRDDKPRPGTTVVTKKKDKPKTAPAGGGANPPKPPTRGPKGPNWPNNPDKGNDNENEKKKSLGGLTKGKPTKNDDKKNPPKWPKIKSKKYEKDNSNSHRHMDNKEDTYLSKRKKK
jgi:hypothetical protein